MKNPYYNMLVISRGFSETYFMNNIMTDKVWVWDMDNCRFKLPYYEGVVLWI